MSTPDLRRRIADTIRENDFHSCAYQEGIDAEALTDAVLAVLPGTCDASMPGIGGDPIGPCILRNGHDGPVHQAADGAKWWPTDPDMPTVSRDPRADDPDYDPITGYRTWEQFEAEPLHFTGLLATLQTQASREADHAAAVEAAIARVEAEHGPDDTITIPYITTED